MNQSGIDNPGSLGFTVLLYGEDWVRDTNLVFVSLFACAEIVEGKSRE